MLILSLCKGGLFSSNMDWGFFDVLCLERLEEDAIARYLFKPLTLH